MASGRSDTAASTHWFDEPMRWLQLNLVPDDPVHADVAAWQRYWRDAKVDGLTLSAAGATAFYPTHVPGQSGDVRRARVGPGREPHGGIS